jgi:hypothetical protein
MRKRGDEIWAFISKMAVRLQKKRPYLKYVGWHSGIKSLVKLCKYSLWKSSKIHAPAPKAVLEITISSE